MRGKRSKQYRKLMQSYGMTFGFREPYQVLSEFFNFQSQNTGLRDYSTVDAQMIQDTSRFKMDLLGGLERVLHGKIKPSNVTQRRLLSTIIDWTSAVITQCSIRHLYTLSVSQSEKDPLILLAKSMERRRCNHHDLDEPLSSLECLSSVIDPKKSATNRNRYVVASQQEEVRRYCRGVRGVPLVYVKRSVMVLEPMAERTVGVKEGIEREKFRTGLRARPGKRKRDPGDEQAEERAEHKKDDVVEGDHKGNGERAVKKTKLRGPKGPNPLSVKKAKKEQPRIEEGDVGPPALAGDETEDRADTETMIIERKADGTEPPLGKRKRRRKHKPGQLDELRQEIAEDNERKDPS
ncbi:MAG: hypothetical protein Q9171_006047 [Xanthocarpia ochracea]